MSGVPAWVGPYVRALSSALHQAAPNAIFPPLAQLQGLLRALDPFVSGPVLLPAKVDDRSGLPSWTWVERVHAHMGTDAAPLDERQIADAERLDPALAARLRGRRDLHAHLAQHPILPLRAVQARLERRGPPHRVRIVSDRVAADGRWLRTTVGLEATSDDFAAGRVDRARVTLDPGVAHLLGRHASSPLVAVHAQLAAIVRGDVFEVSRGIVGPLWFPGVAVPDGFPPELGRGLLLHLPIDVLAREIVRDVDDDPLGAPALRTPEGFGWVRRRRFVAGGRARAAVRDWLDQRGASCEVVDL